MFHPNATQPRDLTEFIARAVVAGLFLGLAYRIGLDALETGRVSGLLLVVSELLVVVLTVVRRPATLVDRRLSARTVAGLSILGPLFLGTSLTHAVLAEAVVFAGSVVGVVIVIAGKISLGRSLGLLPANRGIVSSGVYRLVRHPMYLGYLITHVAFLGSHLSPWNVAILAVADVALVVRAGMEEHTLAPDPAYRRYMQLVPWRLVPGIY